MIISCDSLSSALYPHINLPHIFSLGVNPNGQCSDDAFIIDGD